MFAVSSGLSFTSVLILFTYMNLLQVEQGLKETTPSSHGMCDILGSVQSAFLNCAHQHF